MAKAVSSARTGRTTKKNGSNGSNAENTANTNLTNEPTPKRSTGNVEEKIRRRAYELFQEAGAEHGRDQEHWFRADAEVRGKTA